MCPRGFLERIFILDKASGVKTLFNLSVESIVRIEVLHI